MFARRVADCKIFFKEHLPNAPYTRLGQLFFKYAEYIARNIKYWFGLSTYELLKVNRQEIVFNQVELISSEDVLSLEA